MLHVVAVIKAKEGKRDAIISLAKNNLASVRAEDGCIEYGLVVDADFGSFQSELGPDTFLVIEKWRDSAALKAHATAPHMISYGQQIKDWIESRAIHILESVN
jgi:quinol monooxygenase YgiN